jgi:hypothetical protein
MGGSGTFWLVKATSSTEISGCRVILAWRVSGALPHRQETLAFPSQHRTRPDSQPHTPPL